MCTCRLGLLRAQPPFSRARTLARHTGVVDAAKLKEVEDICLSFLSREMGVYTAEVALAQARDINGLRAVFGMALIAAGLVAIDGRLFNRRRP